MRVNRKPSLSPWLGVLLGVALLATPAVFAQDTEAATDEATEAAPDDQTPARTFAGEVVVTAQKREQQLQEVPIAIQAFEGAALEEVNVRDISEVITFVPGASEELSNTVGLRRYQIRGIAQALGDATVGYYLNDSAFYIYGQSFAPIGRTFDMERVEVLRGPQSTLYGASSMGGTIRFITNGPSLNRFEAHVRAAYSTTDGGDPGGYGDVAVSVPIVENKLGLRLVGSYQKVGGYMEDTLGNENTAESEIENYRASLLWAPTDKLMFKLLFARNAAEQLGSTLLASLDPPVGLGLPGDAYTNHYDLFSGTLEYYFDFATLNSTFSYIDTEWAYDVSLPFPLSPDGVLELSNTVPGTAFNNETRLVSANDGPFQWLAGFFYSDTENKGTLDSNTPDVIPFSEGKSTSESISVFAELSYGFMDGKLIPLVGLRYFEDDRSTTDTSYMIQPEPKTFSSVNPRFNLSYLPTDNSNYYLNIAKGFRSGAFNNPFFCEVLHAGIAGLPCVVAVDSDQLWSYEVGTKQTFAGNQVLFDAAVYYQEWQDIRQGVPFMGGPPYADYQAGDAIIPGIDLQLVYTPATVTGLTLRATANWNDAHFSYIDPAIAAATGAEEGDRLPFVPEWTAALAGTYGWSMGPTWMGQFAMSFTHLEPQLGTFGSPAVGDSRDLLRARFGFHNGDWGFFLFGNNLLNENGAIYKQQGGGVLAFTQDYPRQIGVEVTFDF